MGITGKYDLTGIQKAAIAAIKAAIATTTWGASLFASAVFNFFMPVAETVLGWAINWLANRGLIILNLGAIYVNGELDQAAFDKAIEDGLRKVQKGRDKITAAEGAKIDQDVIDAANRFIDFGADPNSVPNNADPQLQSRRDPPI